MIFFSAGKEGEESLQKSQMGMRYNATMLFRKKKRLTELVDCAG